MATIAFTRESDRIVKVDNDGDVMGYGIGNVNIFAHPYEDKVIVTTAGSATAHLNGPASGYMFNVEDVSTPANTGKVDLVNKLVTTIFN